MLASASSPAGYSKFGDTYYFVKKQFFEYVEKLNKESNEIFDYKNYTSN